MKLDCEALFFHRFWIRHVPKYKFTNFNTNDSSHSDFMYINPYYCCFPQVHPFAFIVIVKDSRNWADFWNLKCEYLPNYWSDLSEINCKGFSFKSPLIWYISFSQRAIFGCCIAISSIPVAKIMHYVWCCDLCADFHGPGCITVPSVLNTLNCKVNNHISSTAIPLQKWLDEPQWCVLLSYNFVSISTDFCLIVTQTHSFVT